MDLVGTVSLTLMLARARHRPSPRETGSSVRLTPRCLSSGAGSCISQPQVPPRQVHPRLDRPNQPSTKSSPISPLGSAVRLPDSLPRPVSPPENTRSGTNIHPCAPAHLSVALSPVPGNGRRLQGLGSLLRHPVSCLTQIVYLRIFNVVHLPVHVVDCHCFPNTPHLSASAVEVPGAEGESVPAATSHNRTVPSRLLLARVRPSGLKATL